MTYKMVLIRPKGTVIHSFATHPLLQTHSQIRDEAIPIFYGENHFEITVKRTPEYQRMLGYKASLDVDNYMWHRFLHMWDVFNSNGCNVLHYVRSATLIYQLSLNTGCPWGEGGFDSRLGFRLSAEPFEEDADGNYYEVEEDEDENADGDDDAATHAKDSDYEYGYDDPDELQAEVDALAEDDSDDLFGYEPLHGDQPQIPEGDFDPVGVFELNRGISFRWRNRGHTQYFIFSQIRMYSKSPSCGYPCIHMPANRSISRARASTTVAEEQRPLPLVPLPPRPRKENLGLFLCPIIYELTRFLTKRHRCALVHIPTPKAGRDAVALYQQLPRPEGKRRLSL
jgi:hypothetical protein